MHHHGTIGDHEVDSDRDFIVYGACLGRVADATELSAALEAWQHKVAELKQWNVPADLTIYRWSGSGWLPALSEYELQEWELKRNPTRALHFP